MALNRSDMKALVFQHPAHCISLGFGSGLAPKAPGTFGTLAALPLLWLFVKLPLSLAIILIVLGTVFGIWCTEKTANALGLKDPGPIVWDEFMGLFVSGLPLIILGPESRTLLSFLLIFGLFRAFDIAKPYPVSWFDTSFEGGMGIMLDDLAAGVLAAGAFWLIFIAFQQLDFLYA